MIPDHVLGPIVFGLIEKAWRKSSSDWIVLSLISNNVLSGGMAVSGGLVVKINLCSNNCEIPVADLGPGCIALPGRYEKP